MQSSMRSLVGSKEPWCVLGAGCWVLGSSWAAVSLLSGGWRLAAALARGVT
jgi:hypothetical protein